MGKTYEELLKIGVPLGRRERFYSSVTELESELDLFRPRSVLKFRFQAVTVLERPLIHQH